jgi:hypothetical protein
MKGARRRARPPRRGAAARARECGIDAGRVVERKHARRGQIRDRQVPGIQERTCPIDADRVELVDGDADRANAGRRIERHVALEGPAERRHLAHRNSAHFLGWKDACPYW